MSASDVMGRNFSFLASRARWLAEQADLMPTGKNRVGEASCEYTAVASMGLLLPTGKFIAVPLFAKGTHIFSG